MFAKAAKLFHQTIVEAHELCIVIILKHKLPRTHFRFLVEKHFGAEVALEFIQSGSDVRVRSALDELQRHLGTKVLLHQKTKMRAGQLVLEYYDDAQLMGLYDRLMK